MEPGETQDLAGLSELDEGIILEELKIRYMKDNIYTYVGDILVALNPFKNLHIYSSEYQRCYRNAQRSQNQPHIFAVADSAYQQMCTTGRNQCCVISGESGAGKTESAKLLVAQLMELSQSRSVLEQKIVQANPLLEAFGNARTAINNNSSRFGKYLQLKFKHHQVTGAKINEYLLEKSRVVSQAPQEYNFHIFYYLLSGLDSAKKAELGLTDPSHFHYLQKEPIGGNATHEFKEVCNALDLVGFDGEFQENLFICLAAILHLGNIEFYEDSNDYSHILDPRAGPVQRTAELLCIDVHHLVEILTVSLTFTRGEIIRRHLSKHGALAARDAIAKALYDRIFRWLVNRINQLLAPTAAEMAGGSEIGILDIFGFEKFEMNSFEQMCINVANEQLQYFFTEHVFLLEEEEHKKEGLGSLDIHFTDNRPLLEMFLSKPMGVYAVLDEQCNFPRANASTFVSKLVSILKKKKSSLFIPSKNTTSCLFSIQHYAGKVEYNGTGFLDKNRDNLPNGAISLLKTSTNDLIKLIFTANVTRTGTLALSQLTAQRMLKKGRESKKKRISTASSRPPTVGAQFKSSLSVLMEKMGSASPHFVRCIKPNTQKSPGTFEAETVLIQLRYTGMLETVRVRREGYPYRPPFQEFVEKYEILVTSDKAKTSAEKCRLILSRVGVSGCKVGKTKVFLRLCHVEQLNAELAKVHSAAILLQKIARGFVSRSMFQGMLVLKRKQEVKVSDFLNSIASNGHALFTAQSILCEIDKENPIPSAPPRMLRPAPPPPSAPPISMLTQPVQFRPALTPLPPPPPDLSLPPAEPVFSDLEEDEEVDGSHGDGGGCHGDGGVSPVEEENVFVSPAPKTHTFGRDGTKAAVLRWFEETQAPSLRSCSPPSPPLCSSPSSQPPTPISPVCHFPDWFHGTISRREAQNSLDSEDPGTFLVRVCGNRFGFSVSVKTSVCVLHHVVTQMDTGKYVLIGSPKVHTNLKSLVQYHHKIPINADGVVLTQPCGGSPRGSATPTGTTPTGPTLSNPPPPSNGPAGPQGGMADRGGGVALHGSATGVASPNERSKRKIARTRSHNPELGYGALNKSLTKIHQQK